MNAGGTQISFWSIDLQAWTNSFFQSSGGCPFAEWPFYFRPSTSLHCITPISLLWGWHGAWYFGLQPHRIRVLAILTLYSFAWVQWPGPAWTLYIFLNFFDLAYFKLIFLGQSINCQLFSASYSLCPHCAGSSYSYLEHRSLRPEACFRNQVS